MAPPKLKRGPFGYTPASVREVLSDRDRMFQRAADQARAAVARADELDRRLKEATAKESELAGRVRDAEAETLRVRSEMDALGEAVERSDDHAARAARFELDARTAREELLEAGEELRGSRARITDLEEQLASLHQEVDRLRELGAGSVVISVSDTASTAEELSGALDAAEQAVARIVEAARLRGEEQLEELERTREEASRELDRLTTWRDTVSPTVHDVRKWIEETRERTTELADRMREAMGPAVSALDELSERLATLSELPDIEDAAPPGSDRVEEIDLTEETSAEPEPRGGRTAQGPVDTPVSGP